jgi:gamma-D-glutamyl-L-lysine dipeptidyl-peptidase
VVDVVGRGTIRSAIAPLNVEPRIASEQASQLLRGQSFTVTEERGEWLHVSVEDGYKGWLNRGYTSSDAADQATHFSLGCVVAHGGRHNPSSRHSREGGNPESFLRLPFGSLLFESDRLVSGDAVLLGERRTRFPADAAVINESAQLFFRGTPYQWGGVTPWGADCSGFLQNLFRAHGIDLPRDSGDQARSGNASDSTPRENRAGELLFFSEREDGRITHVGLALGGSRMAHVALGRGGFAVEDFAAAKEGDAYVTALQARFRFARRIT